MLKNENAYLSLSLAGFVTAPSWPGTSPSTAKEQPRVISRKWGKVTDPTLGSFPLTHFNRKWGLLPFFLGLVANKFVSITFVSLIKTIYPRVSTKPLLNDAKSPGFQLTPFAQKRCCFRSRIYKKHFATLIVTFGGKLSSLGYSQNESGAWASTKFRIKTEMWLKQNCLRV